MSYLTELVAIREELVLQQITVNRTISKIDKLIEGKLEEPKEEPAKFQFPKHVHNIKEKIKHILSCNPEGLTSKQVRAIGIDDYGQLLTNVAQCLSAMERDQDIVSVGQRPKTYLVKSY